MLTSLTGDAEVVLQPIFWLLLAVLIVGGLLISVLFVVWLFARWYWIERPSNEQLYRSEFWEERPLIEQVSLPPPYEKLSELKSTEQTAKEKKEPTHLDKEQDVNWPSSENVGEKAESQVLRAKVSPRRAA